MVTRRQFGVGLGGAALALMTEGKGIASPRPPSASLSQRLAVIEKECGGRLGVAVLDTTAGDIVGYRLDERFPMCSTFKASAAAAVLARVDRGEDRLDRRIRFSPDIVLPYSPATKTHADADGMTLTEICEGAVSLSDNTAANLMLDAIGGPAALTAYLRAIGDTITRFDRTEPTLNEARPGDPRDTTTPAAMAATLRRLVLGNALKPSSRALLKNWLLDCKTGDARLRAGVPADWRVGDKTGTGRNGTANDIGVLWPADRAPLVVTVYITGSTATDTGRDTAIANVARAATAWIRQT